MPDRHRMRNDFGITYEAHSTPHMQSSSDKNQVIIGPLTVNGLAETDYWKGLDIDERVAHFKKMGYPTAQKSSTHEGIVSLSKDPKENYRMFSEAKNDRFFILADRNPDTNELTSKRMFMGELNEPEVNKTYYYLSPLTSVKPYADAEATITVDRTLNINENAEELLPQTLRQKQVLTVENGSLTVDRDNGGVSLNRAAVDKLINQHASGEFVHNDMIRNVLEKYANGKEPAATQQDDPTQPVAPITPGMIAGGPTIGKGIS